MKQINFIILMLLSSYLCTAQMYVHDPQEWWGDVPAHIENVDYEVRPAGMYAEVSVVFDLMSEPGAWPTGEGIQLEFVWDFNLDREAVFNDSWLWIEDYISFGEIYEKNQGTAIYEEIVDRRQDPSILTKVYNGRYNFRVYPLLPDTTRKVKLSYLVPMDFSKRNPTVDLGMTELFSDAGNTPQNVTVKVHDGSNWFHKPVEGVPLEMNVGNVRYLVEDNSVLRNFEVEFQADDPEEELFFGTYHTGGEQYYQLVYYPELEFEQDPTYNLILLDYDTENTSLLKAEFLGQVRDQLENLTPNDYFAVVYSRFIPEFSSDNWMSATPENIATVFDAINSADIDNESNFRALLTQGLYFINDNNFSSRLHIISANTEYFTEGLTNFFLDPIIEFVNHIDVDVDIRVADYADRNRRSQWIDNKNYSGSEYMFRALAARLDGNYYGYPDGDDLEESLDKILNPNFAVINEFDFDLDPTDGLSYSNYFKNGGPQGLRMDQPVLVTGKFVGDYPIEVELKAIHENSVVSQTTIITEPNLDLNRLSVSSWHAEYLLDNEYSSDSEIFSEVVETSARERLLCAQTVFLCLEADTTAISSANSDFNPPDDILISTDDLDAGKNDIVAYPNPFVNEINISLPTDLSGQEVMLEFNDLQGQLINRQLFSKLDSATDLKYSFAGMSELAPGMYQIRLLIGEKIYNLKVMHLAI